MGLVGGHVTLGDLREEACSRQAVHQRYPVSGVEVQRISATSHGPQGRAAA